MVTSGAEEHDLPQSALRFYSGFFWIGIKVVLSLNEENHLIVNQTIWSDGRTYKYTNWDFSAFSGHLQPGLYCAGAQIKEGSNIVWVPRDCDTPSGTVVCEIPFESDGVTAPTGDHEEHTPHEGNSGADYYEDVTTQRVQDSTLQLNPFAINTSHDNGVSDTEPIFPTISGLLDMLTVTREISTLESTSTESDKMQTLNETESSTKLPFDTNPDPVSDSSQDSTQNPILFLVFMFNRFPFSLTNLFYAVAGAVGFVLLIQIVLGLISLCIGNKGQDDEGETGDEPATDMSLHYVRGDVKQIPQSQVPQNAFIIRL
jgi:hypothetical protein